MARNETRSFFDGPVDSTEEAPGADAPLAERMRRGASRSSWARVTWSGKVGSSVG